MPTDCISYQHSGYFSALMNDYLDQKPQLSALYNRFPTIENFEEQIAEKQNNFNPNTRAILVEALLQQYNTCETSEATNANIKSLASNNTFTITTGHQLNLFTGPLYFLYKIISTINLTKTLQNKYPKQHFVPVYWMATEDHDFEEINYFNFKGKKFRWNQESTGPVGRLSTAGLNEFLEVYQLELGSSSNATTLKKLFEDAYIKHDNLADATRFLANELFGAFGLVIIDADSTSLKRLFVPHVKQELLQQTAFEKVTDSIALLKEYTVQVNPREINLFYIENDLRERIILEDGLYKVNHTKLSFTQTEILDLLESNPEKFSPNVIMRPLYQEVILPNLCYIGGGGEIAYWLELKSYFEASNITFPMLLLRNSVVLASEKQAKKADKLQLSWTDLFKKQADLLNQKTIELSEFSIELTDLKAQLQTQFKQLYDIAEKTDESFVGALKAQETKQIKGLQQLEKRLLKAQKRNLSDILERISAIQNELFPNGSLQERQTNFSEFYLEYGENLIPNLIQKLDPLDTKFDIIVL